jgi:predicted MPP superfamily phosphohydrolase
MGFYIFATIFLSVMTILTLLISRRFVRKMHFSKRVKLLLNIFLTINLIGVLGYFFVRYNPVIPNWAYFLLSIPIGVIFLLFFTTVIYELFSRIINKTVTNEKRRAFFRRSLDITALTVAASVNVKAMDNARNIQVETVNINIKNLLKPYTIIQLSDIHIGGLIDQDFISNLVKKVNSLNPDIIVITGDLVDTNLFYAKEALDELKNLKSKYGNYFIIGNHEYFHNVTDIIKYVNSLNIKTLENENVYIGEEDFGFNLAGVYDIMGYRVNAYVPNLKKALDGKMANNPTILLAHQPKFVEEVKDVDLVLSGHTHGGQIFPFNFLVKLQQPYVKGLHQHNEKTQIYVNKGTGFWGPPMRLGASSEISQIKLQG